MKNHMKMVEKYGIMKIAPIKWQCSYRPKRIFLSSFAAGLSAKSAFATISLHQGLYMEKRLWLLLPHLGAEMFDWIGA